MMKKFLKTFTSFVMCFLLAFAFTSCSSSQSESSGLASAGNLRVTAYVLGTSLEDENFDFSNFSTLTDIILFSVASFDENGEIKLEDNFESSLAAVRSHMKTDGSQKLYINLLGPSNQSDSDDWNEQMSDLAKKHNSAFESGVLEKNIKSLLDDNDFDGVFFDYEYPLKHKNWKIYNNFLVSLDSVLTDKYKIGVTVVEWNAKYSSKAKEAVDFFELMSYDNWDEDGNHSTTELAKQDTEKLIKKGYDKSKIDLGLPFYARPTTEEAYWYDYKSYYDKIDENGLYKDSTETKLTFSFNTVETIKEKTEYAISEGLGGVMVWHYACDLPADNEKSLFVAIKNAKQNNN